MLHRRRSAKTFVAAAALAVTVTAGGVGFGQSSVPIKVKVDAKVIPNKAGTPRHPQGVVLDVTAHISIPNDYDPPLLDAIDVWISKGGLYNGARYPSCSQVTLARKGLQACPKGSIMGHGSGNATADTVVTHPHITVVNGGATRVYFYTVLTNPARVQAPIVGVITKIGRPWSYRVHATIPKSLQVVAGIPLRLSLVHIRGGRGDWLATTSCPRDHRWRYHAVATFTTGQHLGVNGSVPCR